VVATSRGAVEKDESSSSSSSSANSTNSNKRIKHKSPEEIEAVAVVASSALAVVVASSSGAVEEQEEEDDKKKVAVSKSTNETSNTTTADEEEQLGEDWSQAQKERDQMFKEQKRDKLLGIADVAIPPELHANLYSYQHDGLRWMHAQETRSEGDAIPPCFVLKEHGGKWR
jgi:hypothetical protein